ncbi:cellulose biosynthesis protein BcsC [Melaminivora alkalimesophila]|uniref:cellulose biosynthesis protein BcsC n=2 Tax=Melaminivora alkalimesophila TaxID=1165852 RepID=UPI000D70C2B8|nr:cellulose biosynthesis protein BcsC [Melaminivora alkalimesophila]
MSCRCCATLSARPISAPYWSGALATLERIPEQNRTRDIAALQKRVWVHVQAEAASALAREGRVQQAQSVLMQAEPFIGQEPELLGAVALAWADVGDPNRALAMVRDMLARTPRPEVGLRLQYAAALLKTQQDVELAGVLRQLQDTPMSAQDRRSFEDIRVGYILRQVDGLRQAGDLAGAYDMLAPLLAERPQDPEVVGALARMYADHGDHAQAMGLYQRLLERDPRNVGLLLAAANTATGAKDHAYAESAVQIALQIAPQDPDVLTTAGRVYRAKGQASKAGQYFAAAIEAENRQRAQLMVAAGQGGGPAVPGAAGANPFRRGAAQSVWGGRPVLPVGYAAAAPAPQPFIPQPAGVARFAVPPAPPAPNPATYYGDTPAAAPTPPASAGRAPARSNGTPAAGQRTPQEAGPPSTHYLPVPGAAPAAPLPSSSPWAAAPLAPPNPAAAARPRTALDELAELQEGRATTLSVGVVGRARQGEAGLSRLTDMQAPVELKFPAGDGMMAVRVTPTGVGAGTPDTSYGTLSRFGAGPATALDMPTRSPGSQSDGGVGLGIAYETERLAVDVGTLPLGFRQVDVMGGLRYRADLSEQVSLTGELSRRPVTDSLLSFAGARDARTGEKWGAVSSNGARLDLTWDDGDFGAYVIGAAHALQGRNVQSNTRVELGGGMYWRVHQTPDSAFTAGLNVTGLGYRKNLRYFTYGHGGYFSPQQFLAMSVPFDWAQRSGRLSYQVRGALGVQYFKEDAAPYFPTNRARQAAAAQAASDAAAFGEVGTSSTAIYPGQSKTGLGYSLGLAMEYQLHPQLFVGSHLALDNARNYRQFTGGLYMRYALQPYGGRQALPVAPLKSPYAF